MPPEYQESATGDLQSDLGVLPQLVGALSQLGGTSRGGDGNYVAPPSTTTGAYGQPGQPAAYGPPASGGAYGQPSQPTAYGPPASGGGYGTPTTPSAGYGQTVVKFERGPAYASGSFNGTLTQTGTGTWFEKNCQGEYPCREVSRNGSVIELKRTGDQIGKRYKIDLGMNQMVDYTAPNLACKIVPTPQLPSTPAGYGSNPSTPAGYGPNPGTPAGYKPAISGPPTQPVYNGSTSVPLE